MKIKNHLKLLILSLAVGAMALPMSALAKCGYKSHCGYSSCKGGMIYNENDGRYYSVPSSQRNMVYRSVDGKYIPVKAYSYYNHKTHKRHTMVSVRCETRPAHWWVTTWMPVSKECYYIVR